MSATPTINGASGAYEKPLRYGQSDSGSYTIRTWEGTQSAIESQAASLPITCTWEIREGVGVYTLEARYGTAKGGSENDPPASDIWEFTSNAVEKDILESDNAAVTAVSQLNIARIRDYILNPPKDGIEEGDFDGATASSAFSLYKLMASGVKSVRVDAVIARHTQTVSLGYSIRPALTNVGKIVTSGSMLSQEGMPAAVLYNLPQTVANDVRFIWGWYKKYPTVRMAAFSKMQIEQEWEYGRWAYLLYTAV